MDQSFSSDSESEPLLSTLPKVSVPIRRRLFYVNLLPRGLCLPSKTAVLVLLWTLIVSAIYSTVTDSVAVAVEIVSNKTHFHNNIITGEGGTSITVFLTYLSFVLASLFYPFTGYVADVHIGRYKAVIISLILLLCAAVCFSMDAILYLSHVITSDRFNGQIVKNAILFIILGATGYFFSAIGLAGYRANHIQFGLDQLLEAPNEYQGLFVHWIQMFTVLGFAIIEILMAWYKCQYTVEAKDTVLGSQIVVVFLLILLLLIAYCLRGSFYSRNVRHNPYKIVYKVLQFVRKRKHPFQRSAFNYFNNDYASKIDFAKETYGGPFTTEQVEDVKTFLRMLIVLVVLGPVFILDIPSTAVFSVFAQHFTTNKVTDTNKNCTLTWAVLDSGALKYLSAAVFMVMYIWFIYSFLRNCIPKIFIRLWIAHFLFVVGAVSMLLIDVSGHIVYYSREKNGAMCMFYSEVLNSPAAGAELGMHWGVLILPNLLMGIGQLLIMTNAYEFISAQSPHSMTGLFIGLFLAIRGFFQFLGAVVLYPFFSINKFWKSDHQPVLTCGFGYLLFTCSVAILSLVLLTIVAKRYKFRERNLSTINHMYVE
jgi:peptide/histidine transporter 3/4